MAHKVALHFTSLLLLLPLASAASAQAVVGPPSAPTQPPSSLVQPALDSVARVGSAVDLNRWKGPEAVRAETDGNLASMQKDLQTTLPPLLAAADAAPGSAAATLPVLLNLDALYSVLLRVSLAARTGAPRTEAVALEQAATLLDSARRDLGNAVLASAKVTEQRVNDLQVAAQQQQAAQQQPPAVKEPVAAKTKKKATGSTGTR